jgi:hypothetical protein
MDLQPGDTVWILASWLSIDSYLVQGGEVDPQDDRRHLLKDAVCLPAVFDFAHVPHDASTDGTVLHTTKLRLGGPDASDPIVRKSDLDTAVQKLNAVIDSYINHSHLSGTPGNPTGPALSPGSTPVTLLTLPHLTTPNCSPVVSSK